MSARYGCFNIRAFLDGKNGFMVIGFVGDGLAIQKIK
jgi:hypothetical protein